MKKKIWIAAALLVVAVIIGVVIVLVLNNRDTHEDSDQASEFKVNKVGNAAVGEGTIAADDDWLEGEGGGDLETYRYVFNMETSVWNFTDGDSPAYNTSIVNDTLNSNPVYLELVLNSTEEVLFTSDFMDPGDSIYGVELGTHLDKGEYDCTLIYHLMDQEKKEEVDTVRLAITVVIEN